MAMTSAQQSGWSAGVIPPTLVPLPLRVSGQFLSCINNRRQISE